MARSLLTRVSLLAVIYLAVPSTGLVPCSSGMASVWASRCSTSFAGCIGRPKLWGKSKGGCLGICLAKSSSEPAPKKVSEPCAASEAWRWSISRSDPKIGGANDVATFRHVEYGTGIELWQGSFGWFDFVISGEADVVLCDSWGIQMQRNTKVFSLPKQWEKLGEDIAKGEARKFEPGDSLTIGSWTVEQMGGQIVIANKHSKRQRLLLQVDGFTFLGSLSKGLVVQKGEKAVDCHVKDLIGLLPRPETRQG